MLWRQRKVSTFAPTPASSGLAKYLQVPMQLSPLSLTLLNPTFRLSFLLPDVAQGRCSGLLMPRECPRFLFTLAFRLFRAWDLVTAKSHTTEFLEHRL